MQLDDSFYQPELRCHFQVTAKAKKVWATELALLEKFDDVCRKHHLKYYAEYGTLLGAVRHQGFIPWDDDIDVVMFRDDYDKLLSIASEEFQEPYFFQTVYNDICIWAFAKLRDSRTTAIEFPNAYEMNQGIFIDIFPLDDVHSSHVLDVQREFWLTIAKPVEILREIQNGSKFVLPVDLLIDLCEMRPPSKMREFENFALSHFGQSEYVNFITDELFTGIPSMKREWYRDIVYLPFEHIQISAPACYEQILNRRYGNWHEYVMGGTSHEGIVLDPDVPYTQYINLWKTHKDSFQ